MERRAGDLNVLTKLLRLTANDRALLCALGGRRRRCRRDVWWPGADRKDEGHVRIVRRVKVGDRHAPEALARLVELGETLALGGRDPEGGQRGIGVGDVVAIDV